MRDFSKLAMGVLLASLAATLGCTREVGPKTTLKFSLPNTGHFEKSESPSVALSSAGTWGLNNPNSFSEINCYAVFVTAPDKPEGQCLKSDGTVAFPATMMAGLYPAGSTVELDAPAGLKRTIRLVGLKSSTAASCGASLSSGLSASNYSAPFQVGTVTVDLAPNSVNNLTILASLTSDGQFHACSGGKLGAFGPASPGGGTTNPPPRVAIVTGLPNAFSNLSALSVVVSGPNILEYKYKLGPTGSTSCSTPAGYSADITVANLIADSLTGFADGSLTLCVLGKDSNGVYQDLTQSTTYTWIKDTSTPSVAITSPAPGSLVNLGNHLSFAVSGTCSEAGQSIVITDAASASATCVAGLWSTTVDVSSAPDGSINLQVYHSDLAGNSQSSSRIFNKDAQAPTGAGVLIAGGAATTPTTSVTVSLTAIGASEMYVTNDGTCTLGGRGKLFRHLRPGHWSAGLRAVYKLSTPNFVMSQTTRVLV